jgi:hypothetical protein
MLVASLALPTNDFEMSLQPENSSRRRFSSKEFTCPHGGLTLPHLPQVAWPTRPGPSSRCVPGAWTQPPASKPRRAAKILPRCGSLFAAQESGTPHRDSPALAPLAYLKPPLENQYDCF